MSHCLECRTSAPHNYDGLTESCKRHPVNSASPCPCCNSYDFRDDFLLSSFASRADCAECLRVSSAYGLHFGLGYPQEFLPRWQSDIPGDVAKQGLDKRRHGGGCLNCVDGCNVVIGVDRHSSPLCAGKTHLTHLTPVNERLGKKLMAANHGTCLSFGHCDILSSPDCSKDLLTSFNEKTPAKCADEHFGTIAEEKIKESEFFDCSKLDDILVWKKKHLDQLQTQVSENNITDELKDKQTLPVVDSSPRAPLGSNHKVENTSEKTAESLPSLELSAESFERLRVELRRQELRVKLYESMLRKHRRDLQTLQSAYEDQRVSYEEQITTLKQELFQLRESHKADISPTESSESESLNKEVPAEADVNRPHSSHTLEVMHPADDSPNKERQRSSDNVESSGVEVARETELSRLEHRIAAEEQALNFLRDDLASKDQHLKTLRMTLRELSNCNSELLEKNIELETLLNQKLLSHSPRSAKADARGNHLLEEIDRCILDLSRLADALLAMSDGLDPLPLLLLNGQDKDAAAVRCAITPNRAGSVESRIGKVTEMQAAISRIREHIIQRVVISHYK